jgi:peptidoglycan/LPS O-acetylase OafA/YrhL
MLLLSLGNWMIAFGKEIQPLSHFWSLAVEEQFYLAWPTTVRKLTPHKTIILSIGLFSSAIVLRFILALAHVNSYTIYKVTPTHWGGLALGAFLASLSFCPKIESWFGRNISRLMIVSSFSLSAVFIAKQGLFAFSSFSLAFGLPFVELLSLGLVYSALKRNEGLLHSLLNSLPLQWLGRYSYSIYLIHVPCIFIANWAIGNNTFLPKNLIFSIGIYAVVPLLLARLAWTFVEQPSLSQKYRFSPQYLR